MYVYRYVYVCVYVLRSSYDMPTIILFFFIIISRNIKFEGF